MARTVAQAITRARAAINDASGVRARTATCEGDAPAAVNLIKTARPDLFIGLYGTTYEALVSANELPLDGQYFLPVAMFIGAMIEHQDEESADRARGQMLSAIGMGVIT
jgi:hypothetical protein